MGSQRDRVGQRRAPALEQLHLQFPAFLDGDADAGRGGFISSIQVPEDEQQLVVLRSSEVQPAQVGRATSGQPGHQPCHLSAAQSLLAGPQGCLGLIRFHFQ